MVTFANHFVLHVLLHMFCYTCTVTLARCFLSTEQVSRDSGSRVNAYWHIERNRMFSDFAQAIPNCSATQEIDVIES